MTLAHVHDPALDATIAALADRCDPAHPEPLSSQIARELERAIRAGGIEGRTLLPSEAEMARLLRTSTWVVKRAVTHLVGRGLAIRRRGIGTIVVSLHDDVPDDTLAEELPHESGLAADRTVAIDRIAATAPIATALVIEAGTIVQRATRVLHVDGSPVAVLQSHVPAAHPLDAETIARAGLYAVLSRRNARPRFGAESVGARPASAAERALLARTEDCWVLTIERTMLTAAGDPVEHAVHAYLPEHFRQRTLLR
ncbi:GntR family transcriptional regulator [Microbacterium gilvum]|uniref:GntR family transcriptional regulator n=1 Tax=Microbacterium gilvum TaxID=1336204 RepID=A0ABP9A1T8_9MICO